MTIFDRYKNSNFLVPALCLTLVLFMAAQLVVITVLGVSFKGVKQYSAPEQSSIKRSDRARSTTLESPSISAAVSSKSISEPEKKSKKKLSATTQPDIMAAG